MLTSIAKLIATRDQLKRPVGLVPTMGGIHRGHLELVKRASEECETVVGTVFVNPTQFNDADDLKSYPVSHEQDLELMNVAGADLVLFPTVGELYPYGAQAVVAAGELGQVGEGLYRPNHFDGVATVVAKLFALVRPDRVYLGEKDYQQIAVIKRMNSDLLFNVEIVSVPTVREDDGLAYSTRNGRLSSEERSAAAIVYKSLQSAAGLWGRGVRNAAAIKRVVNGVLESEPLVKPQYVSVCDPDSFEELGEIGDRALVSLAVFVGSTRLIDNVLLEGEPAG